ncbi:MAG: NUDIX hydrolase [Rhizobiales bacterium]|nr:NUDIX hydrolase [Hyphomicrobiales bacterium]
MPDDRLYPARPILAASVAVWREGRVLIATRARPPLEGVWSLPGGVVEPGETLAQAALRELREEVAVEARIVGFNRHVEVIERDGQGRVRTHFVVASFVARWLAGEGRPGPEAGAVAWVDPEALGARPTTRELPDVLRAARRIWEAA